MHQCHPTRTPSGDFRPSSNKNCGIRTIEFGPHTQRLPKAKSICKAADLRDYDVACLHQRHCPRSIMATKVLFTRRPFPAFPSNADWRCSLNVKLIQKMSTKWLPNFNVINLVENIYSEDIVSSYSLLFRGALSSGLLNWENISSHLIAYC